MRTKKQNTSSLAVYVFPALLMLLMIFDTYIQIPTPSVDLSTYHSADDIQIVRGQYYVLGPDNYVINAKLGERLVSENNRRFPRMRRQVYLDVTVYTEDDASYPLVVRVSKSRLTSVEKGEHPTFYGMISESDGTVAVQSLQLNDNGATIISRTAGACFTAVVAVLCFVFMLLIHHGQSKRRNT